MGAWPRTREQEGRRRTYRRCAREPGSQQMDNSVCKPPHSLAPASSFRAQHCGCCFTPADRSPYCLSHFWFSFQLLVAKRIPIKILPFLGLILNKHLDLAQHSSLSFKYGQYALDLNLVSDNWDFLSLSVPNLYPTVTQSPQNPLLLLL